MKIISIILLLLRGLEWLIETAQKNQWLNEGEQRQIAKAQAEIIRKTNYAAETLRDIERLTDEQLDDLLRTFEGPKENGGVQ